MNMNMNAIAFTSIKINFNTINNIAETAKRASNCFTNSARHLHVITIKYSSVFQYFVRLTKFSIM